MCKQLKYKDEERSDVYICKIQNSDDGKYFFAIAFASDVNVPDIFPFKFEEKMLNKLEDKNMYRMVIDTDQFDLTAAEVSSIINHQWDQSVYVVYNTPVAMAEYRHLGAGGIAKYACVDSSMAFGAVQSIVQIDARADDTDPDEIDARILVVTFDVFEREDLTTQRLRKRPGDFILKPRMVDNRLVCFDLILTKVYTNYTLIEKSEDNADEGDN